MNGSGCKTCPVKPCHTLYYRGSYCAEQRAKFGLGDPQTNADRIRAMSDEELAILMDEPPMCEGHEIGDCMSQDCKKCILEWLQQPAEEG